MKDIKEELKFCRQCKGIMRVKYKDYLFGSVTKLYHIKYECTCGTQCYVHHKNGEFWEEL